MSSSLDGYPFGPVSYTHLDVYKRQRERHGDKKLEEGCSGLEAEIGGGQGPTWAVAP